MATALTLTPDERDRYIAIVGRRAQTAKPGSTSPDRESLLSIVRQAATQLKSRFGARKVVLFGSLAHDAWFSEHSDVDLAVEGLDGIDYWQAWSLTEELVGDRPVDLVDLAEVSPSLRRAIEEDGIVL